MPVTTHPAPHRSEVMSPNNEGFGKRNKRPHGYLKLHEDDTASPKKVRTPQGLFNRNNSVPNVPVAEYLQSSFTKSFVDAQGNPKTIFNASNGFVISCAKAYFEHLHLVIRPEDVWLAILTQLNFYIQAHAEELRSMFVVHTGKEIISVPIHGETGNKNNPLGFASLARRMANALQENLIDKSLLDWVMPNFSTTTSNDRVVASIAFMGAVSKYFFLEAPTGCGLPSVTLLGTKQDWEEILRRLDRLLPLGKVPTEWHAFLVPVVKPLMHTFDEPESRDTKDFWQRIIDHRSGGSGKPDWYSGWITAFSFWTERGECKLILDDVLYPPILTEKLAQGYVSVDVQINDEFYGHGIYGVKMIAGSMGMEFEASGDRGTDLDTVKPLTGWMVYRKKDENEAKVVTLAQGVPEIPVNDTADCVEARRSRLQIIWGGIGA